MLHLGPAHLIALRRNAEDRIDLNRDGQSLGELEGVVGEAVGVIVRIEESIRRAARVPEQGIEHLLLDLRIAADRARVADKAGDFVTLDSSGYVRNRCRGEPLRNRECIAELVDFNDVWNVPAARAEPDNTSGESQRDGQQPAGRYLPVAFAEYEIGVTFIPFAMRFKVWIRGHSDTPR